LLAGASWTDPTRYRRRYTNGRSNEAGRPLPSTPRARSS